MQLIIKDLNKTYSNGVQAQYSALMVLQHKFTPEIMEHYLKYELDRYLTSVKTV